ncbi:ATP-binding protein [Sphaerisporangium perillae]|uniref:ATP-binding protein n=1 Tax=Sphaerisporangium perillae TaxID=2935860 RepID=UPI00200EAF09|nr:ATP-binding protein [Sphaerisporangium perillae]
MQDQAIPHEVPQSTGAIGAALDFRGDAKAFESSPVTVKDARDFVSGTLSAWGLTTRLDDVRLCVSELATNALVHGDIDGHGYTVDVTATHELVRVEVRDRSKHHPRARTPDDTDTSGRGLLLVSVLSDAWGVEEREAAGKVVWSEFKLGGSARTSGSQPLEGSHYAI